MKKPINEIAKMRRIAGLITESEYQEALQEEKGLVKVGEKILSQDKKPYWADENLNTIDTKTLTTYTKGDYNIEVVESQFYFEGDEENKISFSVSVKVFKDENLIKKKLFYPGAERWKGMSIEDFIDYTTQLINGDVNEYQEALTTENQSLSSQDILKLLANNGIDDDYLEDMGGIESGSDEWLDTLSDLTGKDAYEISIDDSWDEKDNEKIMNFIDTLENMGIELV